MFGFHALLVRCISIARISEIDFKFTNKIKNYLVLFSLDNVKNKSDALII
jgi:hypothetical protein